MMTESGLVFDFSDCGTAARFDEITANGMKLVDFVVESEECLYFLEVKNYQHPNASLENRQKDREMIKRAIKEKPSAYALEMGMKIKDSLLKKYMSGYEFTKKVKYLLFIHLEELGPDERIMLMEKIKGYVPIGLKREQFPNFTDITFDLVDIDRLSRYGVTCSPIENTKQNR
ncbi:hypothetical protein FACS1894188_06230 [Clostridia bacterium]|nr:hypothetical protein FACS1894188_06230 [Clostridia bacterium]